MPDYAQCAKRFLAVVGYQLPPLKIAMPSSLSFLAILYRLVMLAISYASTAGKRDLGKCYSIACAFCFKKRVAKLYSFSLSTANVALVLS